MNNLPIISLAVSVIGLIIGYFGFVVKQNERLARLEVRSDLFWKFLESKLADMLKSPTHLDKDILLDKFKDNCLSLEETKGLRTILTEDFNHKEKSLALAMLIARLETRIEIANNKLKRRDRC